MNRLSKVLINSNIFKSIEDNPNQRRDQLFNEFNGKLIERLLPQFKDNYLNHNKLLQVLLLLEKF